MEQLVRLTPAQIDLGYLSDLVHARVPIEHRGREVRAPIWAVDILTAAHILPAMRRAIGCRGLRRARVDATFRAGAEVVKMLGGTEALATFVAAA